nr:MAG TPA: hypothetical protein [Caudoviricetes sp.]
MVIVRLVDLREADFCNNGAREFASLHNLDWQDFLENGIDAKILLATKDACAKQVVRIAMKRIKETDNGC